MRILILLFTLAFYTISCGESKDTPLIEAIRLGNTEEAKTLIESGIDINAKGGKNNSTALMWASIKGYTDIVASLIEAGADVNIKNKFGVTALMSASSDGYIDIVKLLKEAGAKE